MDKITEAWIEGFRVGLVSAAEPKWQHLMAAEKFHYTDAAPALYRPDVLLYVKGPNRPPDLGMVGRVLKKNRRKS